MDTAEHDTQLTLVLPSALEEQVIDLLLGHPELAWGFTATEVAGRGAQVQFEGVAEHVRGRAGRVQVQLVLTRAHADALLALVGEQFAGAGIFYWMTPVLRSGRLA
ncbi:MAG: DUF3240 family protein [Proteobacteria bacterium]|nr:DUF3240 family protein [Pseudomonadota bacterium]